MAATEKMRAHLTHEHQVAAGKATKHGAYSLRDTPLAEWPAGKQLQVTEIAEELALQGAVEEHLRYRVAMGMVIIGCIETYIARELASGTPVDELPILGRWPAFQNSTLRGIAQVKELLDEKPDPDNLITMDDLDDTTDS